VLYWKKKKGGIHPRLSLKETQKEGGEREGKETNPKRHARIGKKKKSTPPRQKICLSCVPQGGKTEGGVEGGITHCTGEGKRPKPLVLTKSARNQKKKKEKKIPQHSPPKKKYPECNGNSAKRKQGGSVVPMDIEKQEKTK